MIRVSDHALLRFLERTQGIDIEALRSELEQRLDRAHAGAAEIGVRNYAIRSEGNQFIVRGGTVTTVLQHRTAAGRLAALPPREPRG